LGALTLRLFFAQELLANLLFLFDDALPIVDYVVMGITVKRDQRRGNSVIWQTYFFFELLA
jgi:hypothetical protein